MAVNDFKPFATGVGANVITQVEYEALVTILANGFTAGTADSNRLNKVWRQSAIMSAVLAQLIVDQTAQDALDDGSTVTLLANLKSAVASLSAAPQLASIEASIGGGALTLIVNPQTVTFRDANLASGAISHIAIPTTLTTVISNGSTGGAVSGELTRLYVAVANNAGTPVVAWINTTTGVSLDETGVITTLAEGGTGNADAANQWYSTNAVGPVSYRVLGFVEFTQALAGDYTVAPSKIQAAGGQALSSLAGIGNGQTWQDMLAPSIQRVTATPYTNLTGRPIQVSIMQSSSGAQAFTIDGISMPLSGGNFGGFNHVAGTFIIPPYSTYESTGATILNWVELR